jgi:Kef-type K+ transport system membrane component KefB
MSKTKINLILDIALFLIFLAVYQAKATGDAVHEWLGVSIALAIIAHILLHWQWVVNISQRFFKRSKPNPGSTIFSMPGFLSASPPSFFPV